MRGENRKDEPYER